MKVEGKVRIGSGPGITHGALSSTGQVEPVTLWRRVVMYSTTSVVGYQTSHPGGTHKLPLWPKLLGTSQVLLSGTKQVEPEGPPMGPILYIVEYVTITLVG